jgi:hypothetical protein
VTSFKSSLSISSVSSPSTAVANLDSISSSIFEWSVSPSPKNDILILARSGSGALLANVKRATRLLTGNRGQTTLDIHHSLTHVDSYRI